MFQRWSKSPESKLLQKEAIKRQRQRERKKRRESSFQRWVGETKLETVPKDVNVEYTRISENVLRKRRVVVEL